MARRTDLGAQAAEGAGAGGGGGGPGSLAEAHGDCIMLCLLCNIILSSLYDYYCILFIGWDGAGWGAPGVLAEAHGDGDVVALDDADELLLAVHPHLRNITGCDKYSMI